MDDSSHGSAHPSSVLDDAQNRDHTFTDSRASACTDRRVSVRRPTSGSPAGFGRFEVAFTVPDPTAPCSGATSDRLRRIRAAEARRASIEHWGSVPASVPMWSSREAWTDALRVWAASPEFRAVRAQLGARGVISAAALAVVAVAMAEFADHATGRNVAVTNRVLAERAGCSERTVTTARTVLAAGGFAVEAARGHGSAATHTAGNRPSIWHLVSSRHLAPEHPRTGPQHGRDEVPTDVPNRGQNAPAAVDTCDLPPSRRDWWLSSVERKSPSVRERARAENSSPKHTHRPRPRRRYRATPRPLAVQRLAAGLVTPAAGHGLDNNRQRTALIVGLDRGHLGAICDAITAAGIDPTAWTPKALTAALNADMKTRGWSWPDRIERPGAFLASRLRRLPARPDPTSPVYSGLEQDRRAPVEPSASRVAPVEVTAPERAQTPAGPAYARRVLADHQQRRAAKTRSPQTVAVPMRQSAPPPAPASTECATCGCAGAPRRRFLPAHRSHVCDACWDGTPDQGA